MKERYGKWEKRCLKTKGSNLKEIFPKREEVGGNEKITLGQNKGRKEKKYGKEIKCKQGGKRDHIPLFEITLSDPVKTVGADRSDRGQQGDTTQASHRKVTLVLDGFEAARRGHISSVPSMSWNMEYDEQRITSTATGQSGGK